MGIIHLKRGPCCFSVNEMLKPGSMMQRFAAWVVAFCLFAALPINPEHSIADEIAEASGAAQPYAHASFHAVGLYWKPEQGAPDNTCQVRYRAEGDSNWRQAPPLWFDATAHKEAPHHSQQYRGSIMNLLPATTYEIRLSLDSGQQASLTVTTQSEDFPIAQTVTYQGQSDEPLVIAQGGSAEEGYVLHRAASDGYVIDVSKQHDVNVLVQASWVIIQGMTLRGAGRHGIRIEDASHVVIEECDIADWGSQVAEGKYAGFGRNFDSAIFSNHPAVSHIIIQRNRLHHPTYDTNAWDEFGGFDHPQGPQGISLQRSQGHHVIRYNHIYSDDQHKFNDGMGEWRNFGYNGFPNRDSDIYGNIVSHAWDDAIEAEGSGMNVRIWSNYAHHTFIAFGLAAQSLGPLYLYRNVSGLSQRGTVESGYHKRGGSFAKIGAEPERASYAKGRIEIIHNTVSQPPSPWSPGKAGCNGIRYSSSRKVQENIRSRNNILAVREDDDAAIIDHNHTASNDFDYDLTNGRWGIADGQEPHGILAHPVYASAESEPPLRLRAQSPGVDEAVKLPGLNDAFGGEGPDIGAYETGALPLSFGVDADWTPWARWFQNNQ